MSRSNPPATINCQIRQADHDDRECLSALAVRSKAHWGYDDQFMAACRDELTVTPGDVDSGLTWLAEQDNKIVGFYGLVPEDGDGDLAFLFIEPAAIGSGVGGALFTHMLATAARAGFNRVTIASDPQAEGFYQRRGATRIGEIASDSIPGRSLPLLEIRTESGR